MNESTPTALRESHPSLVHRFNNFLTLCMTHAEVALESKEPEELETALQWILEGARGMAPARGPHVQHELTYDDREETADRG